MKIKRRIVPFTTLFLTNSENFQDLNKQAVEWCMSDSFNPEGKIFIIDCLGKKINIVSRFKERKASSSNSDSLFSLFLFIFKMKPSYTIDFCNTKESRFLLFFSRSGRTVSKRDIFSSFFSGIVYSEADKNSLKTAVPFFFNNPGNERFSYRTTKLVNDFNSKLNCGCIDDKEKEEEIIIDLGNIPKNSNEKILWIPKRTTAKGMWNDFITLTYFAEKTNCTIDVHFKNDKILKKFSCVFFIKGRKMDFDKYLTVKTSESLNDVVFEKETIPYKHIIFSFGLTPEFRNMFLQLKKIGEADRLITMSRIGKASI